MRQRRHVRARGRRLALRLRNWLGGRRVRHTPRGRAAGARRARLSVRARRRLRARARAARLGLRVSRGPHGRALRTRRRPVCVRPVPQRRALCGRRGLVGVRVCAGLGGRQVQRARRAAARHVLARLPAGRRLRA